LKKLEDFDFYFVTYSSVSKNGIISDVKNVVDAGCRIVQYREKNKSFEEMVKEAKMLKQICEDKAVFLVDDHIEVALTVEADGIHLGQGDTPTDVARTVLGDDKIIGLTVHNVTEAVEAAKLGVDYIGIAPIFSTDTKEDSGEPCGVKMIKKIREYVTLPIIAVGGITRDNIEEVIEMGADGVVAVSYVLNSDDVYSCVKDFIRVIREVKKK
jgi:thiamine-phosphate pyrophosphorylase